jgi:hypothetical protein
MFRMAACSAGKDISGHGLSTASDKLRKPSTAALARQCAGLISVGPWVRRQVFRTVQIPAPAALYLASAFDISRRQIPTTEAPQEETVSHQLFVNVIENVMICKELGTSALASQLDMAALVSPNKVLQLRSLHSFRYLSIRTASARPPARIRNQRSRHLA